MTQSQKYNLDLNQNTGHEIILLSVGGGYECYL